MFCQPPVQIFDLACSTAEPRLSALMSWLSDELTSRNRDQIEGRDREQKQGEVNSGVVSEETSPGESGMSVLTQRSLLCSAVVTDACLSPIHTETRLCGDYHFRRD